MASRTESLIWSAILSGCPSVTDSEVKRRPVTADSPCRSSVEVSHTIAVVPYRGTAVSGLKASGHFVPDDVGQRGLRSARHLDGRAVGAEQDGLVVRAAEHRAPAHVVDDEQVAAL